MINETSEKEASSRQTPLDLHRYISYGEFNAIRTGYTSHSDHGRLVGCESREEICPKLRGIDLLTQIDPSGLWQEELLHLTAQTGDHEYVLGQRIVGGDSRLMASVPTPRLERTL